MALLIKAHQRNQDKVFALGIRITGKLVDATLQPNPIANKRVVMLRPVRIPCRKCLFCRKIATLTGSDLQEGLSLGSHVPPIHPYKNCKFLSFKTTTKAEKAEWMAYVIHSPDRPTAIYAARPGGMRRPCRLCRRKPSAMRS